VGDESGEKELITAPLGELVLPGVTRDSIIAISKAAGIKVSERKFYWSEFSKALKENRLLEVFGAGTAAIVAPVDQIQFRGEMLQIPCDEAVGSGPLAKFFYDEISAMQRGAKPSPSDKPWSQLI
jgi:branched-chain amino acid aminotransferase